MELPERVVMSSPRLDAGGAGYIVTLSHAIKNNKQKSSNIHPDIFPDLLNFVSSSKSILSTDVSAVMGMDLSLGIVNEWLFQLMPFCRKSSFRCFLFDNHGYLIVHPTMLNPMDATLESDDHSLRLRQTTLRKHLTHLSP